MTGDPKLLSRDEFREGVFARDGHCCVICKGPAVDAHHIMERRLFPDGGYYLDNGASVCEEHHIACEQTTLSVEDVRAAAGITRIVVPPHLYPDQPYDKWGNPVSADGRRQRGELFDDESVQKILAKGGVLDLFQPFVKYPRTHHFAFSGNINDDDRVVRDLSAFEGQRTIATLKMDGENTNLYGAEAPGAGLHARSVDGRSHPSRDWVKNFRASICGDIPTGWRVCGENLFARHSIAYDDLPSYFMGFSIWNEANVCLPWDETCDWFELLGITPVPVLYDGPFDLVRLQALAKEIEAGRDEGFVVRVAGEIAYRDFRAKVAKWVRPKFSAGVKHNWMAGTFDQNGLATAEAEASPEGVRRSIR